jgi:hypothetical protein
MKDSWKSWGTNLDASTTHQATVGSCYLLDSSFELPRQPATSSRYESREPCIVLLTRMTPHCDEAFAEPAKPTVTWLYGEAS